VPGKIIEKIILRVTEKHLIDSAVINHSQHGFKRSKACLENLISFYDAQVTWAVDQDFDTVSHSILLDSILLEKKMFSIQMSKK